MTLIELRDKRDLAAKAYRDKAEVLNKSEESASAEDNKMLERMRAEIEAVDVEIREAEKENDKGFQEMKARVEEMDSALKDMRVGERETEKAATPAPDYFRAWMDTGRRKPTQ